MNGFQAMTGIIFDLDGIVVNTVPIHFNAWKKMFAEYGISFSFDDYKEKVDGIPRIDGAKSVLKELSEKELIIAAQKKQKYFLEILDSGDIPIHKSTVQLIKQLKNKNIPLAIISSSKNCIYILKKIGVFNLVDVIIDGNRKIKGKPAPDIFLCAAKELKVEPERCIVFEDASLGVESANNAGMYVIGIDRYSSPERLSDANMILTDISEISLKNILNLI